MNARDNSCVRLWLTLAVVVAECAHLAWEISNGGIVSHHVLDRVDLRAISNALGLLLLPALTWCLSGLALRRVGATLTGTGSLSGMPSGVIVGFAGALMLGIALSACFSNGYETADSFLFFGMFVLALLLRVYRAECAAHRRRPLSRASPATIAMRLRLTFPSSGAGAAASGLGFVP